MIRWVKGGAAGAVRALAIATFLLGCSQHASAGEIADAASQAESLLGSGQPAEALAAFDTASAAFWAASPLQLRTALFADSVKGFGQYQPRSGTSFKPGETALVYLEPVGYAFTPDGDQFRIGLATGVEIRTPGGITLGKTDELGKLDWTGRAKSHEVHASVSLTLPALKAGDYEMVLTLRDEGSAKSTTTTLPFTIAP